MLLSPSASSCRERGESPGLRGGPPPRTPALSTVVFIAWAASLAAFVALWTLAPSVLFLQSMQHHAAAGAFSGSADEVATISAQAALQHSRRMRGVPALMQGSAEPTAAVAALPDCQRLQQAQPTSSEQHNATGRGGVLNVPQPDAHAADPQSRPHNPQQHPQQQLGLPAAQPPALDPLHGLPVDLVKQLGPVDVVYMWVNGSDPVLAQELQEFEARQRKQPSGGATRVASPVPGRKDNPVHKSRFDADRDELRYSLRSLEMYMPWFNRVWIVTNGQVPTWLNQHLSRVTVVPHSSIFKNHTHLPTFNSNAILTNIANIPGLSETFVMMDDDLFLTAPWTLADFVGPDGGQVLTGSTAVSKIKPKGSLFFEMLVHNNELFDKHFGLHPRFDPAHAPRLFQKKYLQELQQKIPEVFDQTSASPARSPTDLMIGSGGYMWYVSQFQPGKHPIAPDARTTFSTVNDGVAQGYWHAAVADFRASLAAQDPLAMAYNQQHAGHKWFNLLALEYQLQSGRDGPKLAAAAQQHLHKLIQTWTQPGAKNVVLNDDVTDAAAAARPLMNAVVRGFLEARYSRKSRFELSPHAVNGCEGRLPRTEFGKLPTHADYKLVCKPPPPPSPTTAQQHAKQVPAPSSVAPTTKTTSAAPHAAAAAAPAAVSTSSAAKGPSLQRKAVPTLNAPVQVGSTHTAIA